MRLADFLRRRSRSITSLMALVATAAVAAALLRPTPEALALRLAREHLERKAPGAYLVTGASAPGNSRVTWYWLVTYVSTPGRGGDVVTGAVEVGPGGRIRDFWMIHD